MHGHPAARSGRVGAALRRARSSHTVGVAGALGRRAAARAAGLLAATCALAGLAAPAPASAAFGFQPGSFVADAFDAVAPGGVPVRQAGAHPFEARVSFAMNLETTGSYDEPDEHLRTIDVTLPRGFVGDPQAAAQCSAVELLAQPGVVGNACPVGSQIGTVDLELQNGNVILNPFFTSSLPLYNMAPGKGKLADFAFAFLASPVHIVASLDPANDYAVRTRIDYTNEWMPPRISKVTLWGVPGDAAHDALRFNPVTGGFPGSTSSQAKPFLTLPAECDVDGITRIKADSWTHPGAFTATAESAPARLSGCEKLRFGPSLSVTADRSEAGAPSGVTVDLRFRQNAPDSVALGVPPLRDAKVTLPEGMTINPASADGLEGCTDEQLGLGTDAPVTCPESSKIGTIEGESPVLDSALGGSVYLRRQTSNDPASGEMFRLALVLRNAQRGLLVKLAGQVRVDPRSGRVETTFRDNPQLPVSRIALHLKDGPRAPLSLPEMCGPATTRAELTSWASADPVVVESSFEVGGACGSRGGLAPSMEAGSVNPAAGRTTPFVLRIEGRDGDQNIARIDTSLPPGLLAYLEGVALCDGAQAASGACPSASRVGSTVVVAGPGANPLALPQAGRTPTDVFMGGPYQGQPYSLVIKVPAQAGPFDLGTVVVRAAIAVDPKDAHVSVFSDPLPQMLQGVPVRYREIGVTLDRPGFTFNPTSCREMQVRGTVHGAAGASAQVVSRFQAADCRALALAPVVRVDGGGKGATARFQHPSLRVRLTQGPGQAHLDKTDVVLPKGFNVDLQAPALKAACPREVYAQDRCSPVARVGTVRAVTPVFAEPLTGPAFLLQKKGQLPDIVMRLQNVHFRIDLIGVLDFLKDGRIVTRVKGIPDAPISSFELRIRGGKGGSLLNRSDLCAKKAATQVTFRGQNGKVLLRTPTTQIAGCPKARGAARRASRSAHARSASAHDRAVRGRS